MAVESILTGRKYILLSVDRESPINVVNDPNGAAFEIPTKETGLEWLARDVQNRRAQLTHREIAGLGAAGTEAASDIGSLASSTETREALADIPGTLAEVRETMRSIQTLAAAADTTMVMLRPRIDASSAEIEAAAEELDAMLANLRAVVEPGSPLLTNLEKSLYEISIAAAAMAELADYLQQNPSALLRGKDVEGN